MSLQFLGSEVQKAQNVMVSVTIVPRHEQTGPNPNIIRILVIGEDLMAVGASETAMLEKVNAWRTE